MTTKRAFTLIELLIYAAVVTVLVLAVSYFLLWAIRSNAKSGAVRETTDSAIAVLEEMSREIREASSIYTPTSVYNATSGQLSLETTEYAPAGESSSYIDFFLCGPRVCLKKEGQAPLALTAAGVKVEKLEFIPVASTSSVASIQIGLSVSYNTKSNKPEYQASFNATSTVSIRAY